MSWSEQGPTAAPASGGVDANRVDHRLQLGRLGGGRLCREEGLHREADAVDVEDPHRARGARRITVASRFIAAGPGDGRAGTDPRAVFAAVAGGRVQVRRSGPIHPLRRVPRHRRRHGGGHAAAGLRPEPSDEVVDRRADVVDARLPMARIEIGLVDGREAERHDRIGPIERPPIVAPALGHGHGHAGRDECVGREDIRPRLERPTRDRDGGGDRGGGVADVRRWSSGEDRDTDHPDQDRGRGRDPETGCVLHGVEPPHRPPGPVLTSHVDLVEGGLDRGVGHGRRALPEPRSGQTVEVVDTVHARCSREGGFAVRASASRAARRALVA